MEPLYPLGRNQGTPGIEGWVGHRAGVKELEKGLVSCLYWNSNSGLCSCQDQTASVVDE